MDIVDTSDETTGLPPLEVPKEDRTLWAMVFTSCQADVLSPVDGSPRGVFVFSVRGLVNSEEGDYPYWTQMHLALPHGSMRAVRGLIDEYLELFPEE